MREPVEGQAVTVMWVLDTGCMWVSKVYTKLEEMLRSNPIISLVLGQIGVVTSCS